MEISHLRVFRAVAEAESVTGAARVLNCVQSNVTARIKSLEEELGIQLFYRKPRGMALSPAGRILLDYAQKILHLEKEVKDALHDDGIIKGRLMLGAFESLAAVRLPTILSTYHRHYPDVDLSLITADSSELNRKVLHYEIDGAFVTDGYEMPNIEWREAFREKLVLVYPAGKLSVEKAAQKGLLVFPKPCAYRERLESWCQMKGIAIHQKVELGSADGMIQCVAAGMGVTILPHSLVKKAASIGSVSIRRIGKKLASVPIMFVKRKDASISKPLEAFLDLLSDKN